MEVLAIVGMALVGALLLAGFFIECALGFEYTRGFFRWLFTNANTERIRNLDRDLRELEVKLDNLTDSWWSDYEKAEELRDLALEEFGETWSITKNRYNQIWLGQLYCQSMCTKDFKNYLAQKALDKL